MRITKAQLSPAHINSTILCSGKNAISRLLSYTYSFVLQESTFKNLKVFGFIDYSSSEQVNLYIRLGEIFFGPI